MNSRIPSSQLLHAYDHPFEAAHTWKQSGGKVVGYVSTAVPRELIEAAGCFPLLIAGDVQRVTTRGDEWMEEQFDPMARSIFDMALSGELAFLDLLIVPRVADSFLRLYLYLREVERLGVAPKLPKIYLFDLLQTRHFSSGAYNRERMQELAAAAGSIAGRAITTADVQASVLDANAARAVQRSLASLRRESPSRVPGSLALKLQGASHFLRTRDYAALLQSTLSTGVSQPANGPRVVVAGNAQSSTDLHDLLEAQGFSIVGDYHWLGDSSLQDIVAADDPLLALTDHYHSNVLTSRRYPHEPQEIVEFASRAGADAVVFYLYEQEEALTWDCPHQVRALDQAGITSLVLDNQPYRPQASAALIAQLNELAARLSADKSQSVTS
jgi:benzoyl-CoA reductase/2-hydroxyglutaryl-CoA dehydratase subunit BcrC/BadD/HgdB